MKDKVGIDSRRRIEGGRVFLKRGRVENEPDNERNRRGKPLLIGSVTKERMEKRDNGAGKGNAWGNIFDAYSFAAADTERNIRYNRGEGWKETKHPKNPRTTSDSLFFLLFFVDDFIVVSIATRFSDGKVGRWRMLLPGGDRRQVLSKRESFYAREELAFGIIISISIRVLFNSFHRVLFRFIGKFVYFILNIDYTISDNINFEYREMERLEGRQG